MSFDIEPDAPIHGECEKEIKDLQQALRFAAGYISATPQFKDKHPEEVLDWIMKEAIESAERKG